MTEHRTIERDGAVVAYEVHGDESASGAPLLLTHGYGSTREMWRGNLPALSGGRRVVIWDLPGHGDTIVPPDEAQYSESAAVGHMAAILDACGAGAAIIGGLSLGGYMSLAFARAHPGRTRALLLCDTGPGYKNREARERWNVSAEKRAEAFESNGLRALGNSPETRTGRHDPAGLALAARHLLTQHDARVIESLPLVEVPGLVIVGEEDHGFVAASRYMAAKIPDCALVVIPGAGHASNIDRPDDFDAAVVGWMAGF